MKKRPLDRFRPYFRRYRPRFIVLFACMMIASSMGVVLSYFSGREMIAISDLRLPDMIRYALTVLGVVTIHHFAWFLWDRYAAQIGNRIAADIRRDILRSVLNTRLHAVRRENAGYYLERMNDDTESIAFLIQNVVGTMVDVFTNISFLVIVYTQSWPCALLFTVGIVALYLIDVQRINLETKLTGEVKAISEQMNGRVTETLRGLREIKSMGIRDAIEARVDTVSVRLADRRTRMKILVTILERARTYGQWVLDTLIVLLCALKLAPEGKITSVIILIIFNYKGLMYDTISYFSHIREYFVQGNFKASRILEVLDNTDREQHGVKVIDGRSARVEIKNLTFSYDNTTLLDRVSLTLEPGTATLLVGPSGCGKSTLLSMLLRILPVKDGTITVCGEDINAIREDSLCSTVSLVSQEPFLFHDTVKSNLRIVKPNATDEQIIEACRLARIDAEICALPEGYDTMLTENGDNISGGQRQRLSIARALLKDAPILLFDEPTGALDRKNQSELVANLRALKGKKTMLIVSHQLDDASLFDRVLTLKDGKIIG